MMNRLTPFATIFLLLVTVESHAWSSGGGGDSGCCGAPPEFEAQAALIEQSFSVTDGDTLRRQRWAGTLCDSHPCGEITEEQAKLLLDDMAAQTNRTTDRWFAAIGAVTGVLGVLFGAVALYQTAQANRYARDSDARSIKSELRLDSMERQQI